MSYTGNFHKTQNVLASQVRKCNFSVRKKLKELKFNVETELHIFDTYVSSVLNYGSEIWGFHIASDVEKVYLDFCKRILKVKKSTNTVMVYAELGVLPLFVRRKLKIIKYWTKLLQSENIILQTIYSDMLDMCNSGTAYPSLWLYRVKTLLQSLGFADVWLYQHVENVSLFMLLIEERLRDQYLQERCGDFDKSSKCTIYKNLVDNLTIPFYLRKSIPSKYIHFVTKIRMSSLQINIEQGRYTNIPRNERMCSSCELNLVEDEFHFVLICPLYSVLRSKYIKPHYFTRPSVFKLTQLLSVQNVKEIINLGHYIFDALLLRNKK